MFTFEQPLPRSVYVGLATPSADGNEIAITRFSDVSVQPLQ